MKNKISAVVLTKNEEKNIERCLRSINFCNEVIVIDDYSTDKSLDIVHKVLKVYKVFQRKLDGDFSTQRNFGMEKANNEWVLFVDADEEVTQELKEEIKDIIESHSGERSDSRIVVNNDSGQAGMTEITNFYIRRRDFFWGKEMKFGETAKIRNKGLIRLVKKVAGKWVGKVHEEFRIQNLEFRIGRFNNYLNHYPHQTVKEFLKSINFYSTLRAKELYKQGKKTNIFEIIGFPLGKFLLTYFLKLGFLDGAEGFVYAFFMSFHSFLVRVKLWQYYKNDS